MTNFDKIILGNILIIYFFHKIFLGT